jgi:hypothetical protein
VPESGRAGLEASFATCYLWDARLGAARKDSDSNRASMDRALRGAERLHDDIGRSSPSERPVIHAQVQTARSMS